MNTNEVILSEYTEKQVAFREFKNRLGVLLDETVRAGKLDVFDITTRLKSRRSLERKITESLDNLYPALHEVPDLVGFRIITFFQNEVDRVIDRLAQDFQVVKESWPHREIERNPEALGYPTGWAVIQLPAERLKLVEYERFVGFQAEIQVCSLMQHTWGRIEQHLGYPQDRFPVEMLREFTQLSYLFELSDGELNRVRKFLSPYNFDPKERETPKGITPPAPPLSSASQGTQASQPAPSTPSNRPTPDQKKSRAKKPPSPKPETITEPADDPIGVEEAKALDRVVLSGNEAAIDLESLELFILQNDMVRQIDRIIAAYYDTRLMYRQKSMERLLAAINDLGTIHTLADLEELLFKKRKLIPKVAKEILGDHNSREYGFVLKGVSLFLLAYIAVATTRDINIIGDFLENHSFDEKLVDRSNVRMLLMLDVG
ncbi:MAG: hypothetical protein HQL52_09475 [Magnetococcales bacterium]|nr:hypothetical protein [Magnetococcales bacterium]